jgi:hypothetical protein
MKFKEGDILIDKRGNVYKVTDVRKEDNHHPYTAKCVAGEWVDWVQSFGVNGEFRGTGYSGSTLDVTLAIDYMVNNMWEEYDNE